MAEDLPTTRRCEFEPGFYELSAFLYDPDWGWVHTVTPRHNTDGDVIPDAAEEAQRQGRPRVKVVKPRPSKRQRTPPAAPISF